MNITSINNPAVQASSFNDANKVNAPLTNEPLSQEAASAVQTNISNEAKIGNFLANLNPAQQAEVEDFLSQVHQQKASGTFDAEAMTKQAPDAIAGLSSMLGVSTEGLLSHIPTEAVPDIQLNEMAQANSPAINAYMAVSPQSQRVANA